MTTAPFFSIITSTYNAAATLPRLLDSLAVQTCRDFNWIIQDGASSDDSLKIAESYRDRLPEICVDSRPDKGIYDAWNMALDRWQDRLGEWILFLGADDVLAGADVLEHVREILKNCSQDILFAAGGLIFMNYKSGTASYPEHPADYTQKFRQRFAGMPVRHSALFHKRSILFHKRFNASFNIFGDYDFILRTWKSPQQLLSLPLLVTIMAAGGISNSPHMKKCYIREKRRCISKNLPFEWRHPCRYVALVADAYIWTAKIVLKNFLHQFATGRFLWCKLQVLHKWMTG